MSTPWFLGETRVTMKEAAAIPTDPVDPTTVRRWCSKGVRGVKLERFLEGGRIYTTVEAMNRFRERLNGARQREL